MQNAKLLVTKGAGGMGRSISIPGAIIFCRELPLAKLRFCYCGAHLSNRSQRMKTSNGCPGYHFLAISFWLSLSLFGYHFFGHLFKVQKIGI